MISRGLPPCRLNNKRDKSCTDRQTNRQQQNKSVRQSVADWESATCIGYAMAVLAEGSKRVPTLQSPTLTATEKRRHARTRAHTHTHKHLERVFGVGLLDGVHTHEVYDLLDVAKLFA